MTSSGDSGLFSGLFGRGDADTSGEAWLRAMLDTEAALARAAERAGLVPSGAGAAVTAAAGSFPLELVGDLGRAAAATGNPVPELVKVLARIVTGSAPGAESAVHVGATSQDIIDTAAMLISRQAIGAIQTDLTAAAAAAAGLARAHAGTVMAGRTLLQQAVPVTFGLVAAGWLNSVDEARTGLRQVGERRLAVQFGGAAGTLSALGEAGPAVAELLAAELGLALPVLPWHTDRLRIIELGAALAGTCSALGKIARDVTLLAQSEVAEVSEGGPAGPAGRGSSSAMPHKRNPVASIVILGCSRRAPGLLATLAAAAEQEHQRAAGAWHSEWETLSDLLRLTGSASAWAAELLTGLRPDPARMLANLEAAGGLPLAENLAIRLAPALGRQAARDLVTAASRRAAAEQVSLDDALLTEAAAAGEEIVERLTVGVGRAGIEAALRPESYLGATPQLISRALTAHAALEALDAPA